MSDLFIPPFDDWSKDKPEYIPGTEEYEVTKDQGTRNSHDWVWSRIADQGGGQAAVDLLGALTPYKQTKVRDYGAIGEKYKVQTALDADEAGWRITKHLIPKTRHDADYVATRLVEFARDKKAVEQDQGIINPVYGLDSDEELLEFAQTRQEAPFMEFVRELVDSQHLGNKKRFKADMLSRVRERLLSLDDRYQSGKIVAEQGPQYLDGLPVDARVQAWKDYAYFSSKQKINISDAFMGAAYIVEDFASAMKGFVEAVTPGQTDEYISDAYRRDPKRSQTAMTALKQAIPVISPRVEELRRAQASGNDELFVTMFNEYTDFNNPANRQFLEAVTQLAALREDGAFAPGKTGEKLASFGSGVLEATYAFKNFINDSTSPTSYLFLREHISDNAWREWEQSKFASVPAKAAGTTLFSPVSALVTKFSSDNVKYWDESDQDKVLSAIGTFTDNWNNVQNSRGNLISRSLEAVGFKDYAREAEVAYGDYALVNSVKGSLDPITIATGGASLFGLGAKGVSASAIRSVLNVSPKGQALAATGKQLAEEVIATLKTTPSVQNVIKQTQDAFSKAYGRTLTEAEALAVAMSDAAGELGVTQGKLVREDFINGLAAQNKALAEKVERFIGESNAYVVELKTAVAASGTRPVSGRVVGAGFFATEKFGKAVRKLGDYMGSGFGQRKAGQYVTNFLLNHAENKWFTGTVGIGAAATAGFAIGSDSEEWYSNPYLAGGLGVWTGGRIFLRPDVLSATGRNIEAFGSAGRRIARELKEGRRIEGSPTKSAYENARLELQSARTARGRISDPVEAVKADNRILAIEGDVKTLKRFIDNDYDDMYRGAYHIAFDDIAQGGTIGAAMAWANDGSTSAYGFGTGAASSIMFRGLHRVSNAMPDLLTSTKKDAQMGAAVASLEGIVRHPATQPELIARLREWLLSAEKDPAELQSRITAFVGGWNATGGRIFLNRPGEQAAATLTTRMSPDEVQAIREEANFKFRDDPAQAAQFVRERMAELDQRVKDKGLADSLAADLYDVRRRIDATYGNIDKANSELAGIQARINDPQTSSSTRTRLQQRVIEIEYELKTQDTALKVFLAEQVRTEAKFNEARNKVVAPLEFRLHQVRDNTGGGTTTQVAPGLYINEGPNGRTIHIDIDKADALIGRHEMWEALLDHDAVKGMMPELVAMFWDSKYAQGQRRIPDAVRDIFFDTYTASLKPNARKAYQDEMAAAVKRFEETGDSKGLERFSREATAWWMAKIGEQRDFVPETIRQRGEKVTDDVVIAFKTLFDPKYGIVPKRFAFEMTAQLREAGARFVQSSDGTIRMLMTNNRNEVVRNVAMNKVYDHVLKVTGGKGSPLLNESSLAGLTLYEQAQLLSANGLTWLVDPKTNTPIPGLTPPAPKPQTPPTPPPTAGPTPTGQPPVTPTINGQPVVPPGAAGGAIPPPPPAPTAGQAPTPTPTPQGGTPRTPTARPPVDRPTVPPVRPIEPTVPPRPTPEPVVGPVETNPSEAPDVGQMNTAFNDIIVRALEGVPQEQRGFTWRVDKGSRSGPVVIFGKPTAAEINAVANAQGLPDAVRNNVLQFLTAMGQDGARPIFRGTYVNIHSRGQSRVTEQRRRIGNEYQFVGERVFVPILLRSQPEYHHIKDNKVISRGEYEKLSKVEQSLYAEKQGMQMQIFNIENHQQNVNIAFSEGLVTRDKDGNPTGFIKDPEGKDYTSGRLRELFFDDTEFNAKADLWMRHYIDGGIIDPTAEGAPEGKIVEPSAVVLGDGDIELGAARRDALRAIFGITTRKGRVLLNKSNYTGRGEQVRRGLLYPFEDISVPFLGPVRDTGATSLMSYEVHARGSYNMASPELWQKASREYVEKHPDNIAGFAQVLNVHRHASLPGTEIVEVLAGGNKFYDVYIEGQKQEYTAYKYEDAVALSLHKIQEAQEMADARAYAEKIFKEEAARREREQAKEAAEKVKVEEARTRAEQKLIDEVNKQNKEWTKQIEELAKREARIVAEGEAAARKSAEEYRKAEEKNRAEFERIQKEREEINRKLREDIERRSREAAEKGEKENLERNLEIELERQRRTRELREDIEARSAQTAADETKVLAEALASNAPELDIAGMIMSQVKGGKDLPIVAQNRPLVVRRVIGGKPFVPRGATDIPGSTPAGYQGDIVASGKLGSPEYAQTVEALNRFYGGGVKMGVAIERALNNVWATEMGLQITALADKVRNGKPMYTYRLYGANGTLLYQTEKQDALLTAIAVNENREYERRYKKPQSTPRQNLSVETSRLIKKGSIYDAYMTPLEREEKQRALKK